MGRGVKSLSNPRTDKPIESNELKCINPKAHQAQKVYRTDGLAPTLSANGGGKEVKQDYTLRDTIRLNNKEYHCQGERLYSHNGLSVAVNASGNNDWYTTDDENEQKIRRRYTTN